MAFKAGTNGGGSSGLTVNGNLTTGNLGGAGSPTVDANTNNVALAVSGNVVIGSGGTLLAPSTSPFTISGNFTNSGRGAGKKYITDFYGEETTYIGYKFVNRKYHVF